MHTDAELRTHLERALRERPDGPGDTELIDRAIAATRTEVRITRTPDDAPAIGRSRIGGAPDLPRGMAWPRQRWTRGETWAWDHYARRDVEEAIAAGTVVVEGDHIALALPFVAQLDLAELAPLQTVFPRRGHLWLFADQSTTVGEIDSYPVVASACLFAVDAELDRVTPPPVPERFSCGVLAFELARSLPDAGDLALDAEWYVYTDAIKPFAQPDPRHACLSRPEHGSTAYIPPDGWTAILRVDSDHALGTHWGDAAWITFAIPDEDLAAERFEEVRAFRWIG